MLSDKVFSFVVLDKGEGGRGRGSLPEPRTLVKGNYILIPFRNLVYIWLPGTSANCLQCLSLCLLGVCVRRIFPAMHTASHKYTRAHRRDCRRLWLAQNTTHAGVITMQVDSSNYCVNSSSLSISFPFFFFFKWQNTACRTRAMLLIVGLASQLTWTPTASPQPRRICMKVLTSFKV